MGFEAANAAVAAKAEARRAAYHTYIAAGMTVVDANAATGVTPRVLQVWRKRHPAWWATVKAILVTRDGTMVPERAFVNFRQAWFAHATPAHHMQIASALEAAGPKTTTLILAFPLSGKTTMLTDYVCYKLAHDPNYRIAVVTEGQDLARKIIGQVGDRMTDDALFAPFITRFGPFRTPADDTRMAKFKGKGGGKPWNADLIQVHQASHDEKEPSLEARGAGSRLYGARYDLLYIDDIQSDITLDATPKILNRFRQTWFSRLDKDTGGHAVITGSRVGQADIYQAMIDEELPTRTITIPALDRWVDRDDHYQVERDRKGVKVITVNPDCPAKPAWPERYSLYDFAVERETVKEEVWARTYMQKTMSLADAVFTEPMIANVKDETRDVGPTVAGTYRLLSIDPALDAGVCCYLACAATSDKLFFLDQHALRDTRRYEDIYAHLISLAATYRPNFVVIEQNNFQKGMLQDDRVIDIAKRFGFQVVSHQTGRNKRDPVLGVAMMASAFSDGEISVPYGTDKARETFGPFFDELRTWRPGKSGAVLKQDRVVAAWFAWLHWEQTRRFYTPKDDNVIRRNVPSWLGNRPRGLTA